MTGKMLLSALAAVASIVVVAKSQDPSFEFPAARHVGYEQPTENVTAAVKAEQQRVSANFKNATIGEVLDWLKGQNVNYVVGDDELDKNARVNLNVTNVSVEDLLKALGNSWQGEWQREGEVYVFHRSAFRAFAAPTRVETSAPRAVPGRPGSAELVPAPQMRFETAPGSTAWVMPGGQMSAEQRKAFEKAMQGDEKSRKEFEKAWQDWSKNYENNFREFEKTMQGQSFKMNPQQREEMAKRAAEMAKQAEKFHFDHAKEFKMDSKQMEEMQKHALEMAKQAEKFQFEHAKEFKLDSKQMEEMQKHALEMAEQAQRFRTTVKDGKVQFFDGKTMKTFDLPKDGKVRYFDGKELKELKGQRFLDMKTMPKFDGRVYQFDSKDMPKAPLFMPGQAGVRGRGHDLQAIQESLTKMQEEKLHRQGYLNYSDLTAKQRALLGTMGGGSWSITYSENGKQITIKSDK